MNPVLDLARRLVSGWLGLSARIVRLAPREVDLFVRRLAGTDAVAGLTERERLLLRVADETADGGELSDALWRELQRLFDKPEQLEVLLLVGHYAMLTTVLEGLRAEPSDTH